MKRSGPLKRSGGLKRGKPLRRKPRKKDDAELKLRFELAVLRPGDKRACCVVCKTYQEPLDAHHVIAKQEIKRYALGEGLSWDELQALLWDPRNGICLCRLDHERHEMAFRRVPRALLPNRCWDFADALDLGHRIELNYPAP